MGELPTICIAIEFQGYSTCKSRCEQPITEAGVLKCMKARFPDLPTKVLLEVFEPNFSCWCEPDWDSIPSFPRFRAVIPPNPAPGPSQSQSVTSQSSLEHDPSTEQGAVNVQRLLRENKKTKNFSYTVPWDELPVQILFNLKMAESKKLEASPDDIDKLKKAIVERLKAAYAAHRLSSGATQLTPGMAVYQDVTAEVHERFKECMKISANGRVLESGYDRFLHSFKIAMENVSRQHDKPKPMMSATIARGTVGVLQEKYNPTLSLVEKAQALKEKEMLKKIHDQRASSWNLPSIRQKMHLTYALQRHDIIQSLEKVKMSLNENQEQDDPDDFQIEPEPEMERLKTEWPFLFHLEWQTSHFQILIGELIDLPLREFCNSQIDDAITFLANEREKVSNAAIKAVWEKYGKNKKVKCLVFVMMLANHFSEDCSSLIRSVEKTTLPFEVMTLPNMTAGPCVIALDSNKYHAERFYACIDKVVVLEAGSSEEAFLALMQGIFIFDCNYPSELVYTMEYLERVVCALAAKHSRLGDRQCQVMTATVVRFVNKLKTFSDRLRVLIQREEGMLQ